MKLIVTITGPSCAGKSTMEKMLQDRGFANAVSTTTRMPRDGEVDGKAYHFIDKSQFKRLLEQGAFIEHVQFNDNYYGLSALEVERLFQLGRPVVVVVEPEGQKQIKAFGATNGWHVYSVWVDNPKEVIAKRFLERCFSEANKAHGMKCYSDALKTYRAVLDGSAARLTEMMTTEEQWRKDAADSKNFDLRILSFNETNDKQLVDLIRRVVMPLREKKAA